MKPVIQSKPRYYWLCSHRLVTIYRVLYNKHMASLTPGFEKMIDMKRDKNIYSLGEIRTSNPNVYYTISRILNGTAI
jgi:hypothetical protein